MSIFKTIAGVLIAVVLASCGGGGGSSGSTSGSSSSGSTSTTTTTSSPSLALAFTDSAGTVLSINAITSGAAYFAKATLTDASGNAVKNALVNFSTDTSIGKLSQLVALTDASGVAKVQIAPATVSTAGAAALTASAVYSGNTVSASANYQTSAASVGIGAVVASPSSIQALQTSAVTTNVTVGGSAATAGQVSVTFAASCGTFSPATVSTSSTGTASSTYQSQSSCSGNVQLTANAAGVSSPGTGSISVAAATAANILFVAASPTSIVSSSATGIKQSTVTFKVVDSSNNPKSSESVQFTLDSQSSAAGVTFSAGGTSQTSSTAGDGTVSVTVQSGALPTPVVVKAALSSNSSMFAYSSGIVVTAGKASQNKSSLSADKLSIEGLEVDGVTSTLIWRVSDRQGNPVPAGSVVTFVASTGTVGGSCQLDSNSSCSVTYTTSGGQSTIAARGGSAGRVVILAYMDGEESFVDQNGNNVWDSGEPFTDMGIAYRDDNFNSSWDASTEQTYPGGSTGSATCASTNISVQNTCDGTWSASIRVRQTISISLASSFASILAKTPPLTTAARTGFTVVIGDKTNTNLSMPTGSTVSATVTTGSASCSVSSVSPNLVRNQNLAGDHDIYLSGTGCSGAVVEVSVTAPSGTKTTTPFTIP